MLIPSVRMVFAGELASLSRRVNANSQPNTVVEILTVKLIKKGEC